MSKQNTDQKITVLIINGPNLNLLGKRDKRQYGNETLAELNKKISEMARKLNVDVKFFQSNHEGALIDFIQQESPNAAGIIINPGALTHYGYSLHDALLDTNLPIVEVHLSNIVKREFWRKKSVISPIVVKKIIGKKGRGYLEALRFMAKYCGK